MKRRDRKLETHVDGFARVVRIPRRTPSKDVVARGLPASGIKAAARSQRGPTERAARVRVMNVLSAHCDVGAAVARLTDALVSVSSPTTGAALDSLDQLRRSLGAIEARMWTFDGGQARCALLAGNSLESAAAPIAHDEDAAAIQRLRHSGTVYRRLGDVSGLEHLVPAGARSFVAAAATDHEAVSGVLIVGWAHSQPPCDERDIAYLRIAATLLARAAGASATNDRQVRPDAILDSLPDRVALVDREGTIIAVNSAWTYFGRHHIQAADAIGVGASYFDACRRAFANGCTESGVALAGLQAVCKGASESFETSYACDGPTERRWCVMRVTRLRRPEGGAVVAHADVTNSKATELGRHIGEELFHRVADTLAVPIWIASPDGRVIYANQHWLDSVRGVTAEIANSTVAGRAAPSRSLTRRGGIPRGGDEPPGARYRSTDENAGRHIPLVRVRRRAAVPRLTAASIASWGCAGTSAGSAARSRRSPRSPPSSSPRRRPNAAASRGTCTTTSVNRSPCCRPSSRCGRPIRGRHARARRPASPTPARSCRTFPRASTIWRTSSIPGNSSSSA